MTGDEIVQNLTRDLENQDERDAAKSDLEMARSSATEKLGQLLSDGTDSTAKSKATADKVPEGSRVRLIDDQNAFHQAIIENGADDLVWSESMKGLPGQTVKVKKVEGNRFSFDAVFAGLDRSLMYPKTIIKEVLPDNQKKKVGVQGAFYDNLKKIIGAEYTPTAEERACFEFVLMLRTWRERDYTNLDVLKEECIERARVTARVLSSIKALCSKLK